MSATAVSEQLYCANCSDPVDAVDENHYGRCCHTLPNPWHRGSDGLYTQPSDTEDAEDEDEDHDRRPACPYCGARHFVIHAREWRLTELTTTVSGLDNADCDSTLWYDYSDLEDDGTMDTNDFEISRVVCAGCRREVAGDIDIEQL
jgi:DNA-directed RNA polymerase subunit RPC12/RpoP